MCKLHRIGVGYCSMLPLQWFPACPQQALHHVQEQPPAAALDGGRNGSADADVMATAHLLAGLKAPPRLHTASDAPPSHLAAVAQVQRPVFRPPATMPLFHPAAAPLPPASSRSDPLESCGLHRGCKAAPGGDAAAAAVRPGGDPAHLRWPQSHPVGLRAAAAGATAARPARMGMLSRPKGDAVAAEAAAASDSDLLPPVKVCRITCHLRLCAHNR